MPINSKPIDKGSVLNAEDKVESKRKNTIEFLMSEPIYTFEDMVISDELKSEIIDAIAIFQYRDKIFDEWNLSRVIKKPTNVCINFYGESGTGKTMAANAVASMLGMKILKVNYADIESKYVGETSKNLVSLFKTADQNNAIILFDEADALLSRRVTDMGSATDVSVNQTRSVLLNILDSYGGMVLFTTNFISNYDPAFMRRIPNHIKFELPNENVRYKLLRHYLEGTVPNSVILESVAKKYEGITGADIANAVLTSAVKVARSGKNNLEQQEFEAALKRIISSKNENKSQRKVVIEEREVSEEYAMNQMDKGEKNT